MDNSMPNSELADRHCATCVCNRPHTMENFNRRCDVLARSAGDTALARKLPIELRTRVVWSRVVGLHWTGWKLGAADNLVAGQLIACIEPDERYAAQHKSLNRYFAVSAGRLLWPSVVEYRPGDEFDITGSPRHDEIELMMDWSDDEIEMYFRLHANALVSRIAQVVRPRSN